MPVLATITAISMLRGDNDSQGPFFDPEKMRVMLTDGLEGSAENELQSSLRIVEQLESLLARYRASVDQSIDAYTEELSNPDTDAADLIRVLAPLDRERVDVLESIISYRQQLAGVLGESAWTAVFN